MIDPLLAALTGLFVGVVCAGWSYEARLKDLRGDMSRRDDTIAHERATSERLMGQLLTMRQQGFLPQVPAKIIEGPDPEKIGLERAEQQLIQRRDDASFIQKAKADIMKRNPRISDKDALAEAWRLRRSVTDEDPPT